VPSHIEGQLRAMVEGLTVDGGRETVDGEAVNERPRREPEPPGVMEGAGAANVGFWAALAQKKHLPDEIMELRKRAIELHKRESLVHGQMGVAARAGKRKVAFELAKEIMENIRPELDGIYDAVREWEVSGKLPPAPVRNDAVKEALELSRRLKYCNERVCRIGRWLTDGYREKTVKGKRVKVLLDAKDVQELDGERLGLMVEAKEIKEKLGI